jgi:hypothetical protein
MNKLKTLNDFHTLEGVKESERRNIFNRDELQDAARDWIKNIEKMLDYGFEKNDALGFMIEDLKKTSPEYYGNCEIITDWADSEGQAPSIKDVLILWIKHFFNLEDE